MAARMTGEQLQAEYMFGMLDYTTWIVRRGDRQLGVVTINMVDHSAQFTGWDGREAEFAPFLDRSYAWWLEWVRLHMP